MGKDRKTLSKLKHVFGYLHLVAGSFPSNTKDVFNVRNGYILLYKYYYYTCLLSLSEWQFAKNGECLPK